MILQSLITDNRNLTLTDTELVVSVGVRLAQ